LKLRNLKKKNCFIPGRRGHYVVTYRTLEIFLKDVVGGQNWGTLPAHPVQPKTTQRKKTFAKVSNKYRFSLSV
jgi:hypothetical protein